MSAIETAPKLGVAFCLALVVTIVVPYLILPEAAHGGISTYYGYGALGPTAIGVFALLTTVVFASAARGRADPSLVAGAALVLGIVMTLIALMWALSVPGEVLDSIAAETWRQYRQAIHAGLALHRWIVVTLSTAVAASAGAYSRALGLL